MIKRILVSIPLVLLLIAVLIFGGIVRVLVFTLFTVLSVYEMQSAFQKKGYRLCTWPAYLFAAAYAAIAHYLGVLWLVGLLFLCLFFTMADRIFHKTRTTEECLLGLLIFLYPLLFYVTLILISDVVDPIVPYTAFLVTFAGPLMGDTLAYFIGKFFGKRKLSPEISPKKTVAGSIAGLFGGALGGALVFALQSIWQGSVPFVHLVIIGFLCGAIGQIGDLFASAIKRWVQIKDYGTIFPGHGGVMDRLDSVLMCAPAVLIYFAILCGGLLTVA